MTVHEYEERLQRVIKRDKVYLAPVDVAPLLEMDQETVRLLARNMPERVPFPILSIGKSRAMFPKVDVVRWARKQLEELKEVTVQ